MAILYKEDIILTSGKMTFPDPEGRNRFLLVAYANADKKLTLVVANSEENQTLEKYYYETVLKKLIVSQTVKERKDIKSINDLDALICSEFYYKNVPNIFGKGTVRVGKRFVELELEEQRELIKYLITNARTIFGITI